MILQPYDMEVGAGTFHPATTLRSLGPKPWNAAYVQPSRRPKDGRYGENPNRMQHYYQFQVIMKPSPPDILGSLSQEPRRNRHRHDSHDIRFVEDDSESPTLGAWGLGWEVWCNGMEVTQFTYFQQVGGYDCTPVSGEITYGLERLATYVQGVDRVYDLNFNGRTDARKLTYGDVFLQAEQEYSRYNFEYADTALLLQHFKDAEAECQALLGQGQASRSRAAAAVIVALPAYDQCIKATHLFNLLDARGVISVDRTPELYPARARIGQGLLRRVACDRREAAHENEAGRKRPHARRRNLHSARPAPLWIRVFSTISMVGIVVRLALARGSAFQSGGLGVGFAGMLLGGALGYFATYVVGSMLHEMMPLIRVLLVLAIIAATVYVLHLLGRLARHQPEIDSVSPVTNLMSERARRMRREKSDAEIKLWRVLRDLNRRGFQFRQQAPIGPYIADFCDHNAKLVLEIDGAQHGLPKGQSSDQRRTRWLEFARLS